MKDVGADRDRGTGHGTNTCVPRLEATPVLVLVAATRRVVPPNGRGRFRQFTHVNRHTSPETWRIQKGRTVPLSGVGSPRCLCADHLCSGQRMALRISARATSVQQVENFRPGVGFGTTRIRDRGSLKMRSTT
jgi:hypothetical protein